MANMNKNPLEYKILQDSNVKIQTILNQWRHQYDLRIISMVPNVYSEGSVDKELYTDGVIILLTRQEKE